jgi:hypothetical protein
MNQKINLLPVCAGFSLGLLFEPEEWRRVAPKRLAVSELHGTTTRDTAAFTVSTARASNPKNLTPDMSPKSRGLVSQHALSRVARAQKSLQSR